MSAPEPEGVPRQRRGITPQMHGRYPDYDILEEQDHWDDATRELVRDRLENVPDFEFFSEEEVATLTALVDLLLAQDDEPRIPVLAYVDQRLAQGKLDGYQYYDMPDDREAWRLVARAMDEEARKRGAERFSLLPDRHQAELCHLFSKGCLGGGSWSRLNVKHAFQLVMRHSTSAFYAHPWSWSEIGFGGPAYPRGYAVFGSSHLSDTEPWEGKEAFDIDPVKDTQERGLD
jgi:Gluconate 2-dehydrogenase subunit 3